MFVSLFLACFMMLWFPFPPCSRSSGARCCFLPGRLTPCEVKLDYSVSDKQIIQRKNTHRATSPKDAFRHPVRPLIRTAGSSDRCRSVNSKCSSHTIYFYRIGTFYLLLSFPSHWFWGLVPGTWVYRHSPQVCLSWNGEFLSWNGEFQVRGWRFMYSELELLRSKHAWHRCCEIYL